MLKEDIGMNAGNIWKLLMERGKLTIREIGEVTSYRESFILMALGWLARENKVRFTNKNGSMYAELTEPFYERYY